MNPSSAPRLLVVLVTMVLALFFLIVALLPTGSGWVVPVLMIALGAGFVVVGMALQQLLEDG